MTREPAVRVPETPTASRDTGTASLAEQARLDAAEAAARSGVRIEPADELATLRVVTEVIDRVWQPPPGQTSVRVDLLRALTHAGNYCTLAWDGSRPVGVCFGFLSVSPRGEFHSHIAGVTDDVAGRHVGRALKLDQRAWAIERGLASIAWTFDPLVRRNAFFNATRLGALPTRYLVDFYGPMDDSINVGQPTDRVKVTWPLTDPRVRRICAGADLTVAVSAFRAAGAVDVLEAVDDRPVRHEPQGDAVRLVQVPADIEALRRSDPGLARRWRTDLGDTLGAAMTAGWRVVQCGRDGVYVLVAPEDPTTPPLPEA